MRWIWAASLSFGLAACEDPNPDVSAHTIMTVIEQTMGDPELLPLTLGALYEHVDIQGLYDDPDRQVIALALGRDDRPEIAKMRCHRVNSGLIFRDYGSEWSLPEEISKPFGHPVQQNITRVLCQFNYFDRVERVQNFLTQAEMWAISHIGPAEQSAHNTVKTAQSQDPRKILSIYRNSALPDHTASIAFLFEQR